MTVEHAGLGLRIAATSSPSKQVFDGVHLQRYGFNCADNELGRDRQPAAARSWGDMDKPVAARLEIVPIGRAQRPKRRAGLARPVYFTERAMRFQ